MIRGLNHHSLVMQHKYTILQRKSEILQCHQGFLHRDEDRTFFSLDTDPAQLKKNPDPTLIRNEKKIYLYFR